MSVKQVTEQIGDRVFGVIIMTVIRNRFVGRMIHVMNVISTMLP